jgi:hypothetical protein
MKAARPAVQLCRPYQLVGQLLCQRRSKGRRLTKRRGVAHKRLKDENSFRKTARCAERAKRKKENPYEGPPTTDTIAALFLPRYCTSQTVAARSHLITAFILFSISRRPCLSVDHRGNLLLITGHFFCRSRGA